MEITFNQFQSSELMVNFTARAQKQTLKFEFYDFFSAYSSLRTVWLIKIEKEKRAAGETIFDVKKIAKNFRRRKESK